ncbi:hypothetical protein EBB79_02335 [Parasedimentitalea marina]|uniref:Uncharacterized protein n=1 Tax=Parasedimentitalea marina TaxID=2483033 RepID=A0A3T0MYK2_9RHOB|nr:hypothetical protein [Parasedimentitalea marina]AZV76848.1 hypothetical protein EBB79_02335 [Parasedimentitalea marina]
MLTFFDANFAKRDTAMTQSHWMLDVLVDLRSFAAANGLGALADQLSKTLELAESELASMNEQAGAQKNGEQNQSGQNPKNTGGHQ